MEKRDQYKEILRSRFTMTYMVAHRRWEIEAEEVQDSRVSGLED